MTASDSAGRAEVLRPGLLTTVQDLGRWAGLGHLGVPPAGTLDEFATRLANRLVGNPAGAAVLECTLRGPALRFSRPTPVAVVGAAMPVTVDGRPVPSATTAEVPAGGVLDIGQTAVGLRCWLAVAGGFDLPPVFGSRSVDTLTGIGGRPLRAGDVLPVGQPAGPPWTGPVPTWPPPAGDGPVTVRVVAGPHSGWFAERLDGGDYTITPRSDRTGLRLAGPPLPRLAGRGELGSHGLVAGAVQVPADGRPVVLLAGRQTTGGYPVPAVVCAADLPLLAQARPGGAVRFVTVDVATARAAYAERLAAIGD